MRRFLLICLLALPATPPLASAAPPADSLAKVRRVPAGESVLARRIDLHTSSKAYRMLYVGVPLVVGGVVMQSYDADFRRLRNGYAPSFHHDFDDYLQYAPAAVMVGMKAAGVRSRSSWGRMLTSDAFSVGLMAIAVNSLKYSCRVMRPDGSSRNSFPSGHTATAFMTATMLHKEYGHRSPWYSIGGYTLATVTGVARQLNNRHWMSDVMVGAGIGILATELGYFLADLIFKERGLNVSQTMVIYDRYRRPSFLGFNLGMTVVPGRYTTAPGMRTEFFSGPSVGVEGAWFASPYWGVGGRLAVANLRVAVNGVSQRNDLEASSIYVGPYVSYPFSTRWLVGARLQGGCERDGYAHVGRPERLFAGYGNFDHLFRHAESRRALFDRLRHGAARRGRFALPAAQADAGFERVRHVLTVGRPCIRVSEHACGGVSACRPERCQSFSRRSRSSSSAMGLIARIVPSRSIR